MSGARLLALFSLDPTLIRVQAIARISSWSTSFLFFKAIASSMTFRRVYPPSRTTFGGLLLFSSWKWYPSGRDCQRDGLNHYLCLAVTSLCHVIQAKGMLEVKRLAVELRDWFASTRSTFYPSFNRLLVFQSIIQMNSRDVPRNMNVIISSGRQLLDYYLWRQTSFVLSFSFHFLFSIQLLLLSASKRGEDDRH